MLTRWAAYTVEVFIAQSGLYVAHLSTDEVRWTGNGKTPRDAINDAFNKIGEK